MKYYSISCRDENEKEFELIGLYNNKHEAEREMKWFKMKEPNNHFNIVELTDNGEYIPTYEDLVRYGDMVNHTDWTHYGQNYTHKVYVYEGGQYSVVMCDGEVVSIVSAK